MDAALVAAWNDLCQQLAPLAPAFTAPTLVTFLHIASGSVLRRSRPAVTGPVLTVAQRSAGARGRALDQLRAVLLSVGVVGAGGVAAACPWRRRGYSNPPMADPRQHPDRPAALASPPIVAVAGWLVPGAGYWLIGERVRAVTVGVSIVILFGLGILIGGVRAIQVPGYGENGRKLYLAKESRREDSATVQVAREAPQGDDSERAWVVQDPRALLRDVGNKPWSICQVLAGPVAVAGGAWSVSASRPDEQSGQAAGVLSHSRINEIGVLYTAVAGMLNLMVIIDAAARAARLAADPAATGVTSAAGASTFAAKPGVA